MKENSPKIFGKNTIKWICMLVCAASATMILITMGMLMVVYNAGFHGMRHDEMQSRMEETKAENYAADLLNDLSSWSVDVYDHVNGTERARTLEDMKVQWAEAAAAAEESMPMDYAVVVSERNDLEMGDLKSRGTYLYCSPEHEEYTGFLQMQFYKDFYSFSDDLYSDLLYVPQRDSWNIPQDEDIPLGKPYYLYVLYSHERSGNGGNVSCMTRDETEFLNALYKMDQSALLLPVLGIVVLLSMVFFCKNVGYRNGEEEVRLRVTDRIPVLFWLAMVMVCELFLLEVTMAVFSSNRFVMLFGFRELATLLIGALLAMALIGLALLSTVCVRLKAKKFLRTTLVYYCYRWIKKLFFKVGNWTAAHVPLAGRLLIALPFIGIISLIEAALIQDASIMLALMFVMARLCVIAFLVYLVWGYGRLRDGAARIAAGRLDQPVKEDYLTPEYRRFAADLNGVGQSIQAAVEDRMKSEHMKTQLITNVSHDIKTPLTSIINYVDLLQKDNTTEEERKEYLGILANQSGRLKKLIQDLIDASKASSGAMEVNLSDTDLSTLAGQVIGEYRDKMDQAGLVPVTKNMEKEIKVSADGNLLWRVMDNLFANVIKYAMPGTRVYMETGTDGEMTTFSISNISKTELGISGDELMERFVRGDQSRNTEGSGLGLSIAKSLMELMGGDLSINVDGDMFKAILKLKRA